MSDRSRKRSRPPRADAQRAGNNERAGEVFKVGADRVSQPLATALRGWLPGKSWSEVRQLVQSRHVLVNGNLCLDAARRLTIDEVVKVLSSAAAAVPRDDDITIRYLDPHVVVVVKPAGMTSIRHPEEKDWPKRRKQLQPTLDELLPRVLAREEKRRPTRKGGLPPIRAVHRLDRETSGLMVFARTVDAESGLGKQFRKHTIHRRYLAIAKGDVEAATIETFLVPDRGDKRRGSTNLPDVGKRAVTHVSPIEQLNGYTLVECRLETGRTHQIRIHLAELGHPICGERVYNKPLFGAPIPDKSGAKRIALHAAELGFVHPITEKQLEFKTPMPPDMARLLEQLRRGDSP